MDYSLFEKGHPRRQENSNGIALGRITKVYADERMVEVKTFMGKGDMNDNHIPKAQWLSTDGHPDGDESGFVPRLNSYCLVFFVGGQPFVWGFLSPLTNDGNTVKEGKEKEDLYEGDRVFKTTAGNKIILRSHGEIQIESTQACRTIYFPIRHVINHLCRNYEFQTDGGTINWVSLDDDLGITYHIQELRDDVDRTNIANVEYGTMADDTDFFFRKEIGNGSDDGGIENQVWTATTKPSGETDIFIRVPNATKGFHLNILPTGETKLNINDKINIRMQPSGQTNLNINDKIKHQMLPSGQVDLNINDKIKTQMLPSGQTTIDINDKINFKMTPDGTTTLNSSGAKYKFGHSKIGLGTDSIELLAKMVEQLDNIKDFCKASMEHVHIDNMGYNTERPTDTKPWTELQAMTEKVKADIKTIQGGV
jgi:hypothetical protein